MPPTMNRRNFVALVIASMGAAGHAQTGGDSVSLEDARRAHETGQMLLIDIREPSEHASGVAKGAHLLPMSQISQRLQEVPNDPKKPVLLICNTQNRSSSVLRSLRQRGYSNVRFVQGGMSEWNRRGWPVVRP